MAVAAGVDLCRHGRSAARYKEYLFIWLAGFIGCVMGGVNDLITSSISPEYFSLGKGLPGGEALNLRAAIYGLKEGLSAGVIGGAVCVYASRGKAAVPPLCFGGMLRLLWMPAAGAVAGAVLLPLLAGAFRSRGTGGEIGRHHRGGADRALPAGLVDSHRIIFRRGGGPARAGRVGIAAPANRPSGCGQGMKI